MTWPGRRKSVLFAALFPGRVEAAGRALERFDGDPLESIAELPAVLPEFLP